MNHVTICSDASSGTKATGFAFYLRSNKGTVKRAWFDENIRNSTNAEFVALCGALKQAQSHIDGETKLIIYCDNRVVLKIVDNDFVKTRTFKRYKDHMIYIQELLRPFSIVETRHVQAHTKNIGAKFYMNRWCDINSRRQMRYLGKKPFRKNLYGIKGKKEAEKT